MTDHPGKSSGLSLSLWSTVAGRRVPGGRWVTGAEGRLHLLELLDGQSCIGNDTIVAFFVDVADSALKTLFKSLAHTGLIG